MYKNVNLSNEEIRELFNVSKNIKEIIFKLGLKDCGASRKFIKKLAEKINFNYEEWVSKIRCSKEYYSKHPNFCKQCGKKLSFNQRNNDFCSHTCSALYSCHNVQQKNNKTKICLNCGNEIKRGKYCSINCQNQYEYNVFIEKWLNGENFQRGVGSIPSRIRKYLMELHNNKCEKCGWGIVNEYTNTVPLEIHHIDGDCTNNLFNNLQLLCPNCHSLTENFGSKNKYSKRFHRKKMTKNI